MAEFSVPGDEHTPAPARLAVSGSEPARVRARQRTPLNVSSILAASLELTRRADQAHGLQGVAEVVVAGLGGLLGADQGTIGVLRDGEVVTVASLLSTRAPLGSRFPVGFGVAGWVAATGRPAQIADVREDRRYVAVPYPEVRSFLALPLESGGEMVAVLSLVSWQAGAFPDGSADALAPVTEQAALLLRRAALDDLVRARLAAAEEQAQGALAEALHDLKAPLHALLGFVDVVASGRAGPLRAQQEEFLRAAFQAGEEMRTSLSALLEAGVAADRLQRERTLLAPAGLAEEGAARVQGQARARAISVEVETAPSLPTVEADRAAILQVLANLLQNALRVAPDGSTVRVAATTIPGWVCFMVADQGPGVPQGDLQRIFQRYQQAAGRSETRASGEVGLGLWLARQIVETHGGLIWAENRNEGGARFCFALPADDRHD